MVQNTYPKPGFFRSINWDFIFLLFIFLFSLYLVSFYFDAEYLDTGYQDWIMHAFRIKTLKEYGLISWIHTWSNGISLWNSYQFIPHFIALALSQIFEVSIPRAMVLSTIGQFVILRLFIYIFLRLLKFVPLTCFICALLSFDIGQYWNGVAEFTLLSAFTFFPVIIFLWVKYYEGKIRYFFPYTAGLSFYIHPILGFSSGGLIVSEILFKEQKKLSFDVLIRLILFLTSSSLFWYPIISKYSYYFSNPYFTTRDFLQIVLAPYGYLGLSLLVLIIFFACFIWLLLPNTGKAGWFRTLCYFSLLYLLLIIAGINIDLPAFINQFQFTRGAALTGIAIIFVFANILEEFKFSKYFYGKIIIGIIMFISIIEGTWFASIYSPWPLKNPEDTVAKALTIHKEIDLSQDAIFTPTIGLSSYFSPPSARFPYSAMQHMEPNQLPLKIVQLMLYHPNINEAPLFTVERLTDYLKATGTKYILLDETSPYTNSLLKHPGDYEDLGVVEVRRALNHLFKGTWETRNAVLIPGYYKNDMQRFPVNLPYSTTNDMSDLDMYVEKFVNTIYKQDLIATNVQYPAPDSLQLFIPPNNNKYKFIYLNESYDNGWKAYLHNTSLKIMPSGPNFMLIGLPPDKAGGTLVMKHSWPLSFYISWYLILIVPCVLLLLRILKKLFLKSK